MVLPLLITTAFAAPDPAGIMRKFVADWKRGDLAAMYVRFTPEFQQKWDYDHFKLFWVEPPIKFLSEEVEKTKTGWEYEAESMDSKFVYRWQVDFDKKGLIALLRYTTEGTKTPYPSPHEGEVVPVAFTFPFAAKTGAWTLQGEHHRGARSQRFAYDMTLWKDGADHAGDAKKNESYYAYGQDVYAPAPGEVVAVHDGDPDNAPPDMAKTEGNSVLLKVADKAYLYMTHMAPGSIKVAEGQSVARGALIGKVGNSGRSTAPHLHIELIDGPSLEHSDAYPLWFSNVVLNGNPAKQALAQLGDTMAAEN